MQIYRIKVEDIFYIKLIEELEDEILIDTVPIYKLKEAALYSEEKAKEILAKLNNDKALKDVNMNFSLEPVGGVDFSMEYSKIKCNVCKKNFELNKENKYIVVAQSVIGQNSLYEAFDCPFCGCQNTVNNYKRKSDISNKKVSNNEIK